VYERLAVPYDSRYPAISGSGFGFHAAVTDVAYEVAGIARMKEKSSAVKIHSRV
jgi:hypothetical protein